MNFLLRYIVHAPTQSMNLVALCGIPPQSYLWLLHIVEEVGDPWVIPLLYLALLLIGMTCFADSFWLGCTCALNNGGGGGGLRGSIPYYS